MTPMEMAKEKRVERKKIVDAMNAIIMKSEVTAEDLAQHTKLDGEQKVLGETIARLEAQDTLNNDINGRREYKAVATGRSVDEVTAEEVEHKKAFRNYLVRGMNNISDDDRRIVMGMQKPFSESDKSQLVAMNAAQSGVDLTGGAILVPTTMATQIESAQKAYGGMIDPGVCYQFNTDMGNELVLPTDDDTSNEGEMLGENKVTGEQGVAFGGVTVRGYIFSSKIIKVPVALLQDSAFDLETFLAGKIGVRLARAKNRKFTTGTGASQPMGVYTIAPVGKVAAAGQTASIVWTDFQDLKHSVDPAYRTNGRYMFHDTTLLAAKKLVDGVGRPLWQSGVALKEPDTLDGEKFTINQHAPVMAASANSMAYGDFSKYYIRNVGGTLIMRLSERYADQFQVAFLAFQRADGQLVDAGTHPIKLYQNAAS